MDTLGKLAPLPANRMTRCTMSPNFTWDMSKKSKMVFPEWMVIPNCTYLKISPLRIKCKCINSVFLKLNVMAYRMHQSFDFYGISRVKVGFIAH